MPRISTAQPTWPLGAAETATAIVRVSPIARGCRLVPSAMPRTRTCPALMIRQRMDQTILQMPLSVRPVTRVRELRLPAAMTATPRSRTLRTSVIQLRTGQLTRSTEPARTATTARHQRSGQFPPVPDVTPTFRTRRDSILPRNTEQPSCRTRDRAWIATRALDLRLQTARAAMRVTRTRRGSRIPLSTALRIPRKKRSA